MSEAEFQQSSPTAFDVPRHVAIIMDGNGRWAAGRGLPRAEGHRRRVEALRRTIRAAGEMGIRIVTIFSFSAENWSRPAAKSASSWDFSVASCEMIWPSYTKQCPRARDWGTGGARARYRQVAGGG